jgi:2-polyprenyl-6-methoxyphenol hydroxylase-like FAD-dependent oxidoreductase
MDSNPQARTEETSAVPVSADVVIAGCGPAGLAAAIELGQRGVDVVVLEPRHTADFDRPRAKTTNIRTMEHFRRWGLADALRRAAPIPVAWSQDVSFCTSLTGREIHRFTNVFGLSVEREDDYAESGQQVHQGIVEDVLRSAVSGLPSVHLVTGWSLVDLDQSSSHVDVVGRHECGAGVTVNAKFLLGCDGGRSRTRELIGGRYEGTADARTNSNFVFRAPELWSRVELAPAVQYWTLDAEVPGIVGPLDLDGTWFVAAVGSLPPDDTTGAIALIRAVIGPLAQDVDIELVAIDPWQSRMLVANTYRVGRVFLVGDAAHLNPPFGGHGYNTCVGDAVNIGWKLAATLAGWGSDALLDSYEEERRRVIVRTIEESVINMRRLSSDYNDPILVSEGPEMEARRTEIAAAIQKEKDLEYHSIDLVLGYNYEGSSVIAGGSATESGEGSGAYRMPAQPGWRLPHIWLEDGSSIYDHLGREFSLIRLSSAIDGGAVVKAAAGQGIPLALVDLSAVPGLDAGYGAALILVRPDQHVAWMSSGCPSLTEAAELFDLTLGRGLRAAA